MPSSRILFFALALLLPQKWCRVKCDETEQFQTTIEETAKCHVEFKLDLPEKPEGQHKAPPRSSHHAQAPVLTVGVYQWVELQCTCCCTNEEEQVKRTAARAVATAAARISTTNLTFIYDEPVEPPGLLQYRIVSTNGHVIVPTERRKLNLNTRGHVTLKSGGLVRTGNCDRTKSCIELYSPVYCDPTGLDRSISEHPIRTQGFYLYADNLGHSEIRVELVWVAQSTTSTNKLAGEVDQEDDYESSEFGDASNQSAVSPTLDKTSRYGQSKPIQWSITGARIFVPEEQRQQQPNKSFCFNQTSDRNNCTLVGRWEDYIEVTILLRPQKFYLAADWSAAVIAFMIALSVGCCNDPVLMRAYLCRTKPVMLGLTCQLIVVPLASLGIGNWFGLNEDEAYGLFVVATVPGGGLAYLFTYLVHGDRHLSATMSLVTSLLDTVTSALWTFGVGRFWFARPMEMAKAVGWLLLIAFGQLFGTIMRGCRPSVAHGILTWITRPLLLLAGILMVTLGVYINHYAFTEFNQNLLLSLLLLITCGFTLGWIAGQTTGQEIVVTRALATEAAVFNGLLCIPLLRTTVHAPEGDLAAVVAVWATFLVPIPLVYHGIVSVVHRWMTDYWQRRQKQNEQNGMSAIIANVTGDNGAGGTDLGAASVAAVAAAAIAVAPAIAAGPKVARSRGSQITRTDGVGEEGFMNITDCNADLYETNRDNARRSELEQIPMSQTIHDFSVEELELDGTKHNPGRLRNHIPGPVKVQKSQPHPLKGIHTEDHILPYLLSDYDPRSGVQQPPMPHRHMDESMRHGYAPVRSLHVHPTTHEKHKTQPYTNL
ncbi:Sodium-bile acid cotransporter [Fasciola gigantica]|uniref:Sodium-bile acid cotransporter n=1 Tax=Fasciola gigantica TaxID=46835 RepID=A0A504YJE8_FASGI|nr:Sodium-bile acid cotransporter [Fasciola gigantica]